MHRSVKGAGHRSYAPDRSGSACCSRSDQDRRVVQCVNQPASRGEPMTLQEVMSRRSASSVSEGTWQSSSYPWLQLQNLDGCGCPQRGHVPARAPSKEGAARQVSTAGRYAIVRDEGRRSGTGIGVPTGNARERSSSPGWGFWVARVQSRWRSAPHRLCHAPE